MKLTKGIVENKKLPTKGQKFLWDSETSTWVYDRYNTYMYDSYGIQSEKINYLWGRPQLCQEMGQAGLEKARREYSKEKYRERLMSIYAKALKL